MGWYVEQTTRKDKIASLTETGREEVKCLRHCYRGNAYRGVLWAVWEDPAGRHITCDVLEYRDNTWWNKPLCEEMGPCYYSCPLGYLDMVPPVNADWRESVREYHNKRRKVQHV